ncbi:DUF350 domain-containing protein [Desulfobacter latus]|uniref:DUF350 domain-containing protein n=1 Tax=Desulfobacter latus TaxID=2292 RepID=A0A850SQH2_9BACT|nr:DUF350 domain-containing protein [Desulfobacter latus]NWH03439.1 DUF350 domain-containing protein [Desulfobacter latus]
MDYTETLISMGQGVCYALVSILFIFIAKKLDDWRTRDFDDDRHIDDGNLAVGLRRAGLYLGIAIGMTGALSGESAGFRTDMRYLLIDGVLVTGCLFISRFINDFVMMGHINNDRECIKVFTLGDGRTTTGNTALGIVEAGMYIATGFILNGSMSGGGGGFYQSLGSALVFFVLGQMVLLVFGLVYEMISSFHVRDEIKQNNPAAGIGLAGILVALGIILKSSLSGPFTGWINDIVGFFVYTLLGMILLLGFSVLVDRFLLPTTNIATEIKADKNVAALVVVQATIIAVALIIAHAV